MHAARVQYHIIPFLLAIAVQLVVKLRQHNHSQEIDNAL